MRTIDLLGQVFGRLTVIARAPKHERFGTSAAWICRCACGNTKAIVGKSLRVGLTHSCGCLLSETSRYRQLKHGACGTREYRSWSAAKTRCYNPRIPQSADYGERGITMCERWRQSFNAFFSDMGLCPNGFTLDRIDVNGPYAPENCRWASLLTQANNTRVNHILEFNGERRSIAEWERIMGFKPGTMKNRISRGWSAEKSITAPLRGTAEAVTHG